MSGVKHLRTHEHVGKSLVDVVDWTVKGAVTPVKNREQCDSCWAFLTTSFLEGDGFIVTSNMLFLSEHLLVDRDVVDSGCNGELMHNAFTSAKGSATCTEVSYSYITTHAYRQRERATVVSIVLVWCVDRFMRHEAHDGDGRVGVRCRRDCMVPHPKTSSPRKVAKDTEERVLAFALDALSVCMMGEITSLTSVRKDMTSRLRRRQQR